MNGDNINNKFANRYDYDISLDKPQLNIEQIIQSKQSMGLRQDNIQYYNDSNNYLVNEGNSFYELDMECVKKKRKH